MKKIAIVVLSWNALPLLERYLPDLVRMTPSSLAEIILADNGSTDSSVQFAKGLGIDVIELPINYGFAKGYNEAIKLISNEYVLLLNNDVRVTEGWLEPLYHFMESHPSTVAVQPKIRWDRQPKYYEYAGAEGGYLDYLGYPFCRGRVFQTLEQSECQYGNNPKEVFWTTGAAMLVRREAYLEQSGFDERFFAHQEEIDLCWRWHSEGLEMYVVPESEVFHYGGASLQAGSPKKTFLNFRNNLLMLHKNLPDGKRPLILTARFFLDILASVVFSLQGKPGEAWAVIRAWKAFLSMPGINRVGNRDISFKLLYSHSLLVRYHIFREKTFDRLKL